MTVADSTYGGVGIINDPIHGYIRYTHPLAGETGASERDVLDNPWVQRMRFISQLQSARWVYPSAEHTRFQHLLGSMAVASEIAAQVMPSLREIAPDCPSPGLVESLLRMTALLHDVGHGPFSHFFDEYYLKPRGLSHEIIGARIVETHLGELLRSLRRTPGAVLEPAESLDPSWITFLLLKGRQDVPVPQWVRYLAPIFGGIYTADNMDYVIRDSYMTGVKIGPVDIHRLIYYTFFTDAGLTLHRAGLQALFMFLSARIYLYQNVYYHRLARAIDLQMREIMPKTMALLLPNLSLEVLEPYKELTDWSFFDTLRRWRTDSNPEKRDLGNRWQDILERRIQWRPIYEITLTLASAQQLHQAAIDETTLENMVREELPSPMRNVTFRIDLASKDARPLNPIQMGLVQVYIYDPATHRIAVEPLTDLLDWLPARVIQLRVFSNQSLDTETVEKAVQSVLSSLFKKNR